MAVRIYFVRNYHLTDWVKDTQQLLEETDIPRSKIIELTGLNAKFLTRVMRGEVEPGAFKLNKLHNFLAACQKPVSRKVRA